MRPLLVNPSGDGLNPDKIETCYVVVAAVEMAAAHFFGVDG
jgi:hypothetical protein